MSATATKIILLAMAGGAGTVARYGIASLTQHAYKGAFPLGTLIVNVLGCFLFGLMWSLADARLTVITPEVKLIVLVGFMGAFTTMSTFAFESGMLMRDSMWTLAIINIIAQNTFTIIAVFIGMAAGRLL